MESTMVVKKDEEYEEEEHYSLGKNFEGDASGEIRPFRRPYRPDLGRGQNHNREPNRLISSWVRGVCGCFVCRNDQFGRDRDTKEEISELIRKLKSNHPSDSVTIYDSES